MTNYRPITDIWILARPKLKDGKKYYGAYPAGFLQRARDLLGCGIHDPVLHVCGGMARHYPYAGFGPNDRTLDLDPKTEPDYCQDVTEPWPVAFTNDIGVPIDLRGVIADPPYSDEEATHYAPGKAKYPRPSQILARAAECLQPRPPRWDSALPLGQASSRPASGCRHLRSCRLQQPSEAVQRVRAGGIMTDREIICAALGIVAGVLLTGLTMLLDPPAVSERPAARIEAGK